MEKMLVVIFENAKKAYEGSQALLELDQEGSIAIHAQAVIQKNNDGTVTVNKADDGFPISTVGGTAIGSLIGLLGGPVGVAAGAAVGATAGLFGDLYLADVDTDFLGEVGESLTPGKFAVVADVEEEWITPVDTRMEALGGVVLRTPKQHFEEQRAAKEIAAMDADLKAMKAEHAQARAERKAKIQTKIDDLNRKLQNKVEQAKQRAAQLKKETQAKVQALQKKRATAKAERKAAIDKQITDIVNQFDRAAVDISNQLDQAAVELRTNTAAELRKTADALEKAG